MWYMHDGTPAHFSIFVFMSVAEGTSLLSRCTETVLVYPPVTRSLHSSGSARYNIICPPSMFQLSSGDSQYILKL
jgi:hypothetical protein